jgi:MFS family permease
MVQVAYGLVAVLLFSVCCTVFLPAPNWLRVAVVIGQGLLLGILNSTVIVYLFKCLARGTTEAGRARALKFAFGFGPVAAVAGSLLAQAILAEKIPGLVHPYNFGTLYLIGFPCLAACSFLAGRLVLAPALGGINNLSLYTREMVGRSPIELAGLVMALRFGLKSLAGFGLGTVAERLGARRAMILTLVFIGLGISWPFVSSGYVYLFAFGLMGAGELGGIYFSNYIISISPPEHTTRNVALLALVGPVSSVAPALHGALADHFGFPASFGFGALAVVVALGLLARDRPAQGAAS